MPSPDGEMEPQRWWIECKGRKGTVDPDEIKSAVNNAQALGDLAYLVVVTNTTFSDPTRDWVKQWQSSRPRPKVKLWDHETLERLLSRHPTVVLRLSGIESGRAAEGDPAEVLGQVGIYAGEGAADVLGGARYDRDRPARTVCADCE